jgi:aryl-alcohol dehydrogenase-like predicted oxidoreductase
MELRMLGTSDIKISKILMGTWQAGKENWTRINDGETTKAIQAALDAGVRKQVVIATKVFSNHLKYTQVINACQQSLANLKTDYIDLYQIHWPSGSWGSKVIPIEETMQALNELKEQGKIRAIGVSNFSCAQLEETNLYGRIDSLQPPYSLFWRHVEKDAMPYCVKNNITQLAYSPMAQGLLTGKFGPDHKFDRGDHRANNKLFKSQIYQRAQQALAKLRPIAQRHGVSLGQLALAWVMHQPMTCAIAGARNANQASQNAEAVNITLSEEDLAEMDTIGGTVTDHLDENPVLWNF